jgi:hypothetical protein
MSGRLATILALALIAPGGATLAGCRTDDALEHDAEQSGKRLDRAAGSADEKAGRAAEDAVDAVDDDDGR